LLDIKKKDKERKFEVLPTLAKEFADWCNQAKGNYFDNVAEENFHINKFKKIESIKAICYILYSIGINILLLLLFN